MKRLIVSIALVFFCYSCTKDCTNSQQAKCLETPETGTILVLQSRNKYV